LGGVEYGAKRKLNQPIFIFGRSSMKSKTNAEPDPAQQTSFSASVPAHSEGEQSATAPGDVTRILLVDDHPVVRKGLVACLSGRANLAVIGEAADGMEAIRKVGELSPDLVLMDVEMPVLNGLAATETICKRFPKTRVLVISMHNNPDYVVQAIHMGARGFALKTAPSEELLKAIEIVQRGEPFFPGQSMSGQRTPSRNPAAGPDGLFEREKEVLVYLAMGYSNRDIAELLAISVRTVESHRARLMRKLNIHTIAGLTRYALSKGYISLNPAATIPSMANDTLRYPPPVHGLRV
jgi:two-component system nitrate/nitrite response regulator NarL